MFEAQTGDVDLQQSDVNGKGTFFVNSGVQNFGIKGRTDRPAKIFSANTLTVDFLGNVYYRPFEYKMATHNHVFSLSGEIVKNERVGLYLAAQMTYLNKIFSFNNMGTWPRIKELTIQLPIDDKENIDFPFIEERVRELEEERVRELEAYLQEAGFEDCTLTKDEENALRNIKRGMISSKLIQIDELFDIATGRDIIIGRTQKGAIPLISHQHDNNGISKRIERIANRRLFNHETTLPLADRGVFLATTQSEDFHIGTRVKALTFKNGKQNENVRLFFVTSINKLQILFLDYLTNATDNLPNLKISVPVKEDGAIDYSFMETYISAIKKQCIACLKQEIDIERKAYNKVLDTQHQESIDTKHSVIEYTVNDEPEMLKAAEDYEYYQWNGANKRVIDFFGDNKTILFGCYKNKKHLEWIQEKGIYNIRLGKRKGTMSGESALFEKTVHLVLYNVNHPDKLQVYNIDSCCEMSGQQLKELDYPTQKPGKTYMTFKISSSTLDTTQLKKLRLIERIKEEHPEHEKGTPVFLEP